MRENIPPAVNVLVHQIDHHVHAASVSLVEGVVHHDEHVTGLVRGQYFAENPKKRRLKKKIAEE